MQHSYCDHYNSVFDEDETALINCCTNDEVTPREKYWIRLEDMLFSKNATGLTMPYLVMPMFTSYDEGLYFCLSGDESAVSVYSWKIKTDASKNNDMISLK